MDSCCQTSTEKPTIPSQCPGCHQKGKSIQTITLKALLQPTALETIHAESTYSFCSNSSCKVKVSVFQKDDALDVPVCYCFGWTRERLTKAVQENQYPIKHIREQVQAKRCGCEINNPQGACCLGNVTTFIRNLDKS